MEFKDKTSRGRETTDVALVELASPESRQFGTSSQGADDSSGTDSAENAQPQFKLYRRRHVGALGIVALNIVAGMNLTWFGPIANDTAEAFSISLDRVNWLANIVACTYILVAPFVPIMCSRFGLRFSYTTGTIFLAVSGWVRYAGTAHSLDSHSAYALLIIGQLLAAVPQVIFQVLVPKFSETWFDLKGRTTATMVMSVSNPVGTALGQLISPMIDSVRASILVLGIISTAITPFVLLIASKPPTPPSHSGSQPSDHLVTTLRAIFGFLPAPSSNGTSQVGPKDGLKLDSPTSKTGSAAEDHPSKVGAYPQEKASNIRTLEPRHDMEGKAHIDVNVNAYMTLRERLDFVILAGVFSVLVAGVNVFSILSDELLEPYGYSDDDAGLMGAALLLSGLLAAFTTSPLFDRVLTHHLGLTARINVPIIAAAWLSLIWAVRPNNAGALYAVFVIIGIFSISLLPVALELGCELTRNSETSSAILWWAANVASIVFTLAMSGLRAPPSGSPPLNMHKSLIYSGASICSVAVFIFLFRGEQRRRAKDARIAAAAAGAASSTQSRSARSRTTNSRRNPLSFFRKSKERGPDEVHDS